MPGITYTVFLLWNSIQDYKNQLHKKFHDSYLTKDFIYENYFKTKGCDKTISFDLFFYYFFSQIKENKIRRIKGKKSFTLNQIKLIEEEEKILYKRKSFKLCYIKF